jgi:hypothetical protein
MKELTNGDQEIAEKIYLIRGHKVMLDKDLSEMYGVETKRLIEQVNRNLLRFPAEFMFRLSDEEFEVVRSQFATSQRGGRRYAPYAFTEHGMLMLSSVLNIKTTQHYAKILDMKVGQDMANLTQKLAAL